MDLGSYENEDRGRTPSICDYERFGFSEVPDKSRPKELGTLNFKDSNK